MFTKEQTYNISFNENRTPSPNGAVVILKTVDNSSVKSSKLLASILLTFFAALLSFQVNFVYASQHSNSPITSPVTVSISCASGQTPTMVNSQLVCVSQSQSQSQTQSQNQNQQNTQSNNLANPITAPLTSAGSNLSSGNSNSAGSSSAPSAPSCNDRKPDSAPKLYAIAVTGKNEVTLSWEKAKDPVTHYLISYGLQAGKPLYGNPNVGNVSSYKVQGLSGGTTYYFRVRAVNNCAPGEVSNELSVKVGGKTLSGQAKNFQPGVLSAKNGQTIAKTEVKPSPSIDPFKPAVNLNKPSESKPGLFGSIIKFLTGLFK